jgi:hypothetical protein
MLKATIAYIGNRFTVKLHRGGHHGQFKEAVERLKLCVAEGARKYDKKHRHWEVSPLGERGLRAWAEEIERVYRAAVVWKDAEAEMSDAFNYLDKLFPPSAPHAALFLTPSAPPEVVKAAYEALAQLYADDPEKLKAVTEAYEALTK